jgi:hypothetical protein
MKKKFTVGVMVRAVDSETVSQQLRQYQLNQPFSMQLHETKGVVVIHGPLVQ